MTSTDRPRCGARKKSGGTCDAWPVKGSARCHYHGGSSPQVKARIDRDRRQAEIVRALGGVPAENVDPAEALLQLVSQKWAEVQWLRAIVQAHTVDADTEAARGEDVEHSPLVWSKTKHEVGTGPEGPIDKAVYDQAPSVWWSQLRRAEDQLKDYTTAALRAGVERRQIELQEAQALQIAQAIHRILDQLHLTQEQARRVPDVVPGVLRQLPTEPTTQEGTA